MLQNLNKRKGAVRKIVTAWNQACLVSSWHDVKMANDPKMMMSLSKSTGQSSPPDS